MSTSSTEAAPRPGLFQLTLKVALVRGGELLVLRDRRSGRGDLPGGRLDEGELHADWRLCVERELAEELGSDLSIRLHPEPLFWFKHHIQASGRDALGFLYRADCLGGRVALSDEHDEARWVPILGWDPAEWFVAHQLEAVRRFQRLWAGTEEG